MSKHLISETLFLQKRLSFFRSKLFNKSCKSLETRAAMSAQAAERERGSKRERQTESDLKRKRDNLFSIHECN